MLALALVAGGLATVHAADAPNHSPWYARMFPWLAPTPEAQKGRDGKKVSDLPINVDVAAAQRLRAELDWKRRAEVCQKLREIAAQTNNAELEGFAERLDQRAWDVYVRKAGLVSTMPSRGEALPRVDREAIVPEPSDKEIQP
jgi:hypothetical protein